MRNGDSKASANVRLYWDLYGEAPEEGEPIEAAERVGAVSRVVTNWRVGNQESEVVEAAPKDL